MHSAQNDIFDTSEQYYSTIPNHQISTQYYHHHHISKQYYSITPQPFFYNQLFRNPLWTLLNWSTMRYRRRNKLICRIE